MYYIDELTGDRITSVRKVVISCTEDHIVFGYVFRGNPILQGAFFDNHGCPTPLLFCPTLFPLDNFYNINGKYFCKINCPKSILVDKQFLLEQGQFPYNFDKRYEAIESFNIFNGKQAIVNPKKIKFSEELKYTFGLEFETSMGIIPEDLCFRDGLIPLRDGSITGNEYSTVVLSGESGLNLLYQQLETLKKFTYFNKECSLHVHMGGFPLDKDKIFRLYKLIYHLTYDIANIVPQYSFETRRFKASGKDYCKVLPSFRSFEQFYEFLGGGKFYGDFTQAHPMDIDRSRKWNCSGRYYFCNFINLLFYNVNKTVEFRFLRPTFNFQKIITWLFIFNAILKYAENYENADKNLLDTIKAVYPKELSEQLEWDIAKLKVITNNQYRNGDSIGVMDHFDDLAFPNFDFYIDAGD